MTTYASFPTHMFADLRGVKRLKEAKIGAFLDAAIRVRVIPINILSLTLPGEGTYAVVYRGRSLPPQPHRLLPKHRLSLLQPGRKQQAGESPLRKSRLDNSRMVSTCQLFGKSSTSVN